MRTVFPHEAFITALSAPARELIQSLVDVPAAERAFWLTVLVDTFELDDVAEPLRNLLLPMPAGRLTSPSNTARDHREPPRGDVVGMELVPLLRWLVPALHAGIGPRGGGTGARARRPWGGRGTT